MRFRNLLEKELVVISGRKEDAVGKPLIYSTSKNFMDYFGINSADDLPRIKEVLNQEIIEATKIEREKELKKEEQDESIQDNASETQDIAGEEPDFTGPAGEDKGKKEEGKELIPLKDDNSKTPGEIPEEVVDENKSS